jgi:hypothetical protein
MLGGDVLSKKSKLYHWLLYLTNNETTSKDEVKFDIIFFIGMVLTIVVGIPLLMYEGEYGFAIISILWFLEAWDTMRHNRT